MHRERMVFGVQCSTGNLQVCGARYVSHRTRNAQRVAHMHIHRAGVINRMLIVKVEVYEAKH
eukprot:10999917-Lingulodinium_polyedra.AAC.1